MAEKNRVVSVKQSPLNPLRWCLQLDCGHDVWITSKKKPLRVANPCERCKDERKDRHG